MQSRENLHRFFTCLSDALFRYIERNKKERERGVTSVPATRSSVAHGVKTHGGAILAGAARELRCVPTLVDEYKQTVSSVRSAPVNVKVS